MVWDQRARQAARSAVAMVVTALCAVPLLASDGTLPVPRIAIYPGDVITDAAIADQVVRTSGNQPVMTNRKDVVGKVARRTLVPGRPIPINAIRIPDVVAQGKTYRIQYSESGLIISSYAVALTSGGVGDVVSLRNPDSGSVVRGIVSPDGVVRMGHH